MMYAVAHGNKAHYMFHKSAYPYALVQEFTITTKELPHCRAMLIRDCQTLENQDLHSFFTLQWSRHLISDKEDRHELCVRIVKFTRDPVEDEEKASEWRIERQLELSLGSDCLE